MSAQHRTPHELRRLASRFRVLAEPARLAVLQALREDAKHVSAIVEATGLQQANLSKHLQVLHAYGMVQRSRAGRFVLYAIRDPDVIALCDLMCRPVPARTRPMPITVSSARRSTSQRLQRPATRVQPGGADHSSRPHAK